MIGKILSIMYLKYIEKKGFHHGKNLHLGKGANIDAPFCQYISVGDNVTITKGCYILAHDASMKNLIGKTKVSPVTIGNNVIIGAGAVIAKDIPEDSVVVGNPAKVIGSTTAYIEKNKAMMNDSNVWNSHYSEKSEQEKDQMFKVLSETRIGFDI